MKKKEQIDRKRSLGLRIMSLTVIPLIPGMILLLLAKDNPLCLGLLVQAPIPFVAGLVILLTANRKSEKESNNRVDPTRYNAP